MSNFTVKEIESLIRRKAFGRYSDWNQLYLNLRHPEGSASWLFSYTLNGKRRWHGFGSYDSVHGLHWAREQVPHLKSLVRNGTHPAEQKKAELLETKQVEQRDKNTFEHVALRYIEEKKYAWRSEITIKQWSSSLRDYVYPSIGSKPIHLISVHDVLAILRPIWKVKTETASRVRSRIENIIDYATALEMRDGNNPAVWRGHLSNILSTPSKIYKPKSHAALPYDDLPNFLVKLRERQGIGARALEFLILTCSRTKPVLRAKWEDMDLENAIWHCPGDNMKRGNDFRVPLSKPAVDLLITRREESKGEYVFGNKQTEKMSSNNCMLYTLYRMGYREKVTTHGMRSTMRDWAGEKTLFSERIVEVCLDHAVNNAVEAAYQRGDYLEKRREIMDSWGRFCESNLGKLLQFDRVSY